MSDQITFRAAWGCADDALVHDARAFWRQEDALSAEEIDERVKDLCAVAYAQDRMVAASTVAFVDIQRVRSRLFYYRTIVAQDHRRQHLASRLGVFSYNHLARWSLEHPEEKVMGLLIVIQADEFRHRHQNRPVLEQLGLRLVLIGYTPDDRQMRVIWFDHARVESRMG